MASQELQVLRAAEIHERSADEPRWLIEPLWAAGGVGIIGGSPKSCKWTYPVSVDSSGLVSSLTPQRFD
jgi:hypothetical protein